MKSAIGLIAATVFTTSIFSQGYQGSDSTTAAPQQQQTKTPAYQSRQSESGAPVQSQSGSITGYEQKSSSGGNSSTGQSDGSNIGGKGAGSVDGAIHLPAQPARESSKSEGWSGSTTFSGAGPGAVTGSSESLSVGGPAESEVGVSRSSSDAALNMDRDYGRDLQMRVKNNWGGRIGTDMPPHSQLFDQSLDDKLSNGGSGFGAPGANVSGSASGKDHAECDSKKGKGGAAQFEEGKDRSGQESVRSSGSALDHDQRLNRSLNSSEIHKDSSVSGAVRSSGSAIDSDERLQRAQSDGHLNGNNATGNSGDTESSGDTSAGSDRSVTPPENL